MSALSAVKHFLCDGTNIWSGAHSLDFDTWPNGAVGVIEAEDLATGGTQFADMDNFKAWRSTAQTGESFSDDFTGYAEGIAVVAEPERNTLRRWSTTPENNGFVTNGTLLWIPQTVANGGSWYGPRQDYHNDVRLNLTATNIVEVQVTYSAFSNGITKIAVMPEYFPGEIFDSYEGDALYVELKIRPPGHIAEGNLAFDLYTHHGSGGNRDWEGYNEQFAFADGQTVTFQVSTNSCRMWYGTNIIVNQSAGNTTNWMHSITNALQVYTEGVFPHLEFQNESGTTNATVLIDDVLSGQLSDFTSP